jgi:hypothetical protein
VKKKKVKKTLESTTGYTKTFNSISSATIMRAHTDETKTPENEMNYYSFCNLKFNLVACTWSVWTISGSQGKKL